MITLCTLCESVIGLTYTEKNSFLISHIIQRVALKRYVNFIRLGPYSQNSIFFLTYKWEQ